MAKKSAIEIGDVPVEEGSTRFKQVLASETLQKIQKKWGSSSLIQASDDKVKEQHHISSGSFPLDYALGGGWATGRIHILYGHKSSAKTSTICLTIAEAQKLCGTCWSPRNDDGKCVCGTFREVVAAFIDAEGTFDHEWAKQLGVDTDRLLFNRPDYAEQSLDILEALIRSKDCDLIALDSLAFLTPAKEIEESTEKDLPGLQARTIGKGMRKFVAALNHVKNEVSRTPTIFFTNQIRMKVGVVFGSPEMQPGGLSSGFAATSEVRFTPAKVRMDEESGRPLESEIHFKVDKNKSAVAKMEGDYKIILQDNEFKKKGAVYDEESIVDSAQRAGIVEGRGSSWKCLGEDFHGKSPIEKRLMQDPVFKKKVREAVLLKLLEP